MVKPLLVLAACAIALLAGELTARVVLHPADYLSVDVVDD
jgi:hypothetical protein